MKTIARCMLAAIAAIPAAAQAAPPGDASQRVHAAWLREVLDLDVRGAIAAYEAVAQDRRPSQPERWIAVARLAELERAGLRIEPKPVFSDAPAALQEAFAALTPIPVPELLQRASSDPAALLEAAGTEAGRIPALRPATWQVQDWVRGQGMSLRDRTYTRGRIDAASRPQRPGNTTGDTNWFYAADILQVELLGRQELAANRRTLHFPGWKPPATAGDPVAILARVRANLDAWSKEQGVAPVEGRPTRRGGLLQGLREMVDQRAGTDPAAAVALVARLPLYAERLLAEPPPR